MRRYELHELDQSERGRTFCVQCPLYEDKCTTLNGRINAHLINAIECSNHVVKLMELYPIKEIIPESELISASRGLMADYKSIADSGDCGQWEAEDQKAYKAAMTAISNATEKQ